MLPDKVKMDCCVTQTEHPREQNLKQYPINNVHDMLFGKITKKTEYYSFQIA